MSALPDARDLETPFLIRLFYRNASFHRPDEFAGDSLPPHASIYAWPSCTLSVMALELGQMEDVVLPYPAIGTRLVFQLVCPDVRNTSVYSNSPPRYTTKDIGSIVIGGEEDNVRSTRGQGGPQKTLRDMRVIPGDFISCAILPPLADGSVAPTAAVRREREFSANHRRFGRGGMHGRDNESSRGTASSWGVRPAGGFRDVPVDEWRRGEALPNVPPSRPRGGRW